MKVLCGVSLCLVAAVASAQPDTTEWISHYNGNDGWFEFQGPQRAMVLNPADFGLNSPVQVESLKVWFYGGMGSLTDSVYTFRIYSGNGQTLLWESESLVCRRSSLWVYYGLSAPVRVDTGRFYIAITARLVDPYAHPYINCDDATPQWSLYGQPGAWTVCTVGNYCFFAFVREVATGIQGPRWLGPGKSGWSSVIASRVFVPTSGGARLLTSDGRSARYLFLGENDLSGLEPGVYFADLGDRRLKLTVAP